VALVSGAARGIGAAIAETMVDHGAKVVIGDVLDGEGRARRLRPGRRGR
jgi:3alpha(or 20beta)-hydroxysteroid dehydrogenase